jgi:AraC-like DNA-binding protein
MGVLISVLLLISKYPASRYLGKLVVISLLYLISFAFGKYYNAHYLAITAFSVGLFLYSKAFFIQNTRINPKHILVIIIAGGIPFVPINEVTSIIVRLLISIVALTYITRALKNIKTESKTRGIDWFQNPGSRLSWFRNFIIYVMLMIVAWLMVFDSVTISHASLGVLVLLSFVYFQVIKESSFLSPIILGNKYKKSTLTAYQKHSILGKLDELLKKEKFYLDDSISLSGVAAELHTTTHHLSQVINESKGITFQKLISQYRIGEAKLLLKDEKYENTTIENIAAMVGYNSKSAFNTTFKKITGLTPTDYRAKGGVRAYREEHLSGKEILFSQNIPANSYDVLSLNNTNMLINFLKIFRRTLAKNKVFSIINLFGLTVGFTCCILIYLFVSDELSYDKSIIDSNRIYRVAWINDNPQTRTPHPMAQAMVQDLPEVEVATSLSPWYGPGLNKQSIKVEYQKKNLIFEEPDFYFADSTFFEVFDLELISGDLEALNKPW